ncbi:hypothetical protein [Streptomyces gobiensis]|uniref:hypothetical protein n=1 Tax=Streptomyces gobiensis TaxID=2875706 RepID=UPI001E621383|nr:hypothetical protein [Streptomyces gobiensis]UGY94335.1 hypothetical protein test1122_23115 [Streptomyces gobiensis]
MTAEDPVNVSPRPPRSLLLRRWLTAVIVVLLIAIPAGYLVLSAHQSRDSGKDKEQTASATGLVWQWPSRATRRIYDVPIPGGATYVAYFETNSWKRSSLYVQFRTSPERLDSFLEQVGTNRSELAGDHTTIPVRQADVVGWNLRTPGHTYAGTTVAQPGHRPDLAITVDLTKPERPHVYVVSTAEF